MRLKTRFAIILALISTSLVFTFSQVVAQSPPLTVELSAATFSSTEGNSGTSPSTVSLLVSGGNSTGTGGHTVGLSITPGTVNAGDYATTATISIPEGNYTTVQTVAVPVASLGIIGDTIVENNEAFSITISAGVATTIGDANLNLATQSSASYTILNDDTATITIADASIDEEAANLTFTATTSAAIQPALTVTYTTTGVTATGNVDYTETNTTFSFPANTVASGTTTFNVPILEDTLVENNETFTVTLSNPSVTGVTATDTATGTINNDDTLLVEFAEAATSALEGNTANQPSSLQLIVTGNSAIATSINITIANITTQNNDWDQSSPTVTIPAGNYASTPINVPQTALEIDGDTNREDNDVLSATLGTPSPAGAIAIGDADGDLTTISVNNYTLLNDDDIRTITLAANNSSNTEANALTFTVNASGQVGGEQTISWSVTGTTANAADFGGVLPSGTVTIPNNNSSATITVTPSVDAVVELNETFTVTINAETVGITNGGDLTEVGTIQNDDTATITIADVALDEAATNMTFTATTSAAIQPALTVSYATSNGTATAGTDYTATTSTFSFAAGVAASGTATFIVPILDDALYEANETFTVTLSNPTVNGVTANDTATGTINNDDILNVELDITTNSGDEGNAGTNQSNLQVIFGGAQIPANINVPITRGGGTTTATNGVDYSGSGSSVTIPAGDYSTVDGSITISQPDFGIIGDVIPEPDETVQITLGTPGTGAQLGDVDGDTVTSSSTYYTIINDDTLDIELSAATASLSEGDSGTVASGLSIVVGGAQITSATSVDIQLTNGTATLANSDFSQSNATVTIPIGNYTTASTIVIPAAAFGIVGDTNVEPDETLTVGLTNFGANTQAGDANGNATEVSSTTFTILNDDPVPVNLSANTPSPSTQNEGNTGTTAYTYTVTADVAVSGDQNINYAVTGSGTNPAVGVDFGGTLPSGTVTINDGETTATITINVTGDNTVELDETFTVTINAVGAGVTNGSTVAVSSGIVNDDTATISINSVSQNEGDAGTSNFVFGVTLSNAISGGISIDYATSNGTATAGSDYTAITTTTLNFTTAGTQNVTVVVSGDTVVEPNETFTVNLSNLVVNTVDAGDVSIGVASGTGTIQNQDNATITITDVTEVEGDALSKTFDFDVTLSNAVQGGVSINYASSAGSATPLIDYINTNGTLNFAGTTNEVETISVTVNGDIILEQDETFNVNLSGLSLPAGITAVSVTDATGIGTIENDDTANVTIENVSIIEGGFTQFLQFTATLDNDVDSGFTVDYATSDGTATDADNDYEPIANGQLTFAGTAGETQTFTITINPDTKVEADESFTVTLSNPSNILVTANDTATGTITNDDTATVTISNASAPENSGAVTFTVTTSALVQGGFSVNYSTANGTATAGEDYVAVAGGTVSLTGAQLSNTFNVTVSADTKVEANETFTVTISNVTTGTVDSADVTITTANATGTIINDDTATVTIADNAVTEGASGTKTLSITATVNNAVDGGFTVGYSITGGTATIADSDYSGSATGTLTFAGTANETETIQLTINGDAKVELDETITFALGSPSKANIIANDTATGTITNDDTATVTIDNVTLLEGNTPSLTNFTFTISVDNAVEGGFNIAYATANGTATAGSDYTAVPSTTLSFSGAAGESKLVSVQVIGDDTVETNETFNVNLTKGIVNTVDAADIVLGSVSGIGTINNDDSANLTIDNVPIIEGDSGNQTINFTVEIDKAVEGGFTVSYLTADNTAKVADGDYTGVGLTNLVFNGTAGETKTIPITVFGDTVVEPNEIFAVVLFSVNDPSVTIAKRFGLGQIGNDDSAIVTIADNTITEGNTGTTDLVFTATLDNDVQDGFTVNYTTTNGTATTADNDYTGVVDILAFAGTAGETQTITVSVKGDTKVEANETFTVGFTGVSHTGVTAVDTATGTINNNDTATITIGNVSIVEGDTDTTDISFTATLNNAVQGGFTVNYSTVDGTAIGGVDYQPVSGSLTWAGTAGETKLISVTINNDVLIEPDKTFSLELSGISGAIVNIANISLTSGTATIENNDGASLRINDVTLAEGDNGTTTFTFDLTIDKAVSGGFSVDYTTSDGTATAGEDYTSVTDSVTFAGTAGEVQSVSIAVSGDIIVESDETFNVTLSNADSQDVTIAKAVGVGTITNDDNAALSIDDVTANEGNSGDYPIFSFTVTLDTNVDGGLTVDYATQDNTATAGSDYISNTGALAFAGTVGETQTINVTVIGDPITEPTEIFDLVLSNISNTGVDITDVGVGTITNDDSVALTITDATRIEGNSGTANMSFTVTLQDTVEGGFTVDYGTVDGTATTADSDYTATSGTLTFDGITGEAKTITVPINGDVKVEADETYTIELSNTSNIGVDITDIGTGTITNDDSTSVTINDVSKYEGNSGTTAFTFTATLNDTVVGGFTVNYSTANGTATAGSDYQSASGTLTFAGTAGETKSFTVNVLGDSATESDETFTVSMSNVSNTDVAINDIATGTILNDEFGILSNGGFEVAGDKRKEALDWNYKGPSIKADRRQCNKDTNGDGIIDKILAAEGECAFRFYYNSDFISFDDSRKIKQRMDETGVSAGDTIIFDGLVSGTNFDGVAKIVVKAVYTPGVDVQKFVLRMDEGSYDYKSITGSMVLNKVPPKLVIVIKVRRQSKGAIWFDDLSIQHIVNSAPVATRGNQEPLELPPPPSNFRN